MDRSLNSSPKCKTAFIKLHLKVTSWYNCRSIRWGRNTPISTAAVNDTRGDPNFVGSLPSCKLQVELSTVPSPLLNTHRGFLRPSFEVIQVN